MKYTLNFLAAVLVALNLCSCTGIVRITGFESEQNSGLGYGTIYGHEINEVVTLSSPCEHRVFLLAGPLPIFPNLFYKRDYDEYKDRSANLVLSFCTELNKINLDKVDADIILNGAFLGHDGAKISKFNTSKGEYDYIEYTFETQLNCAELEKSEIVIKIKGLSEDVETYLVFFNHKWSFIIE